MRLGIVRSLIVTGIAVQLTACTSGGDPGTRNPTSYATANQLTVRAAPSQLSAGGQVDVMVTVVGPADYEAGCVQKVHVWAVDAGGKTVWEEPAPAAVCLAIANHHLAPGETASFHAVWPTDLNLPLGTYRIHGLFRFALPQGAALRGRENLPLVTVEITGKTAGENVDSMPGPLVVRCI